MPRKKLTPADEAGVSSSTVEINPDAPATKTEHMSKEAVDAYYAKVDAEFNKNTKVKQVKPKAKVVSKAEPEMLEEYELTDTTRGKYAKAYAKGRVVTPTLAEVGKELLTAVGVKTRSKKTKVLPPDNVDKIKEIAKVRAQLAEDKPVVIGLPTRKPSTKEEYTYSEELSKKMVLPAGLLVTVINNWYHENKRSMTTEELLTLMEGQKLGFITWGFTPFPPKEVVDEVALAKKQQDFLEGKDSFAIQIPAPADRDPGTT